MTSKLTTICGAVGLIASTVATYNFSPMVTKVSGCVCAVATSLGLFFARDNKVSDETAGAKPTENK